MNIMIIITAITIVTIIVVMIHDHFIIFRQYFLTGSPYLLVELLCIKSYSLNTTSSMEAQRIERMRV